MSTPEQVLAFWLDEVGPSGWYKSSGAVDSEIRDRFSDTWRHAAEGGLSPWLIHANGVLAYLVVTDQFSRNIWRGSARSFELDGSALAAAKAAVSRRWDLTIDSPARQFFYLPLMHAENLCDQDHCVRLFHTRMPEAADNLLHARAHREVIRRFGRFPHRNEALGRTTTHEEAEFLAQGGYGRAVSALRDAA